MTHSLSAGVTLALIALTAGISYGCSDSDSTPSGSSGSVASSGNGSSSSSGEGGSSSSGGGGGSSSSGGGGGSSSSVASGSGSGSGGSGGSFPAQECAVAEGVCLVAGECVPQGGAVVGMGEAGCHFDDAPVAECCAPPSPKPNPTTCAAQGGLCASISGCLQAGGYFTPDKGGCMGGPGFVCCVPHVRCGDQTIDCCENGAVYNPACDDGKFVCVVGTPAPVGMCP